MAVSNFNRQQYFKAGVDLRRGHGLFVKLAVDGTAVLTTAATDPVLGAIITPIDKGLELGVCIERGVRVPARVAGAIAIGDKVALTTGGKVIKAPAGTAYIGVCDEASKAADDIITIVFFGLTPGA